MALDIEMFQRGIGASGYSVMGRIALAAGILTSTGTLAMLILTRLNVRGRAVIAPSGAMTSISLQCPKCGKQQVIPLLEPTRCQCGLQISVRVNVGEDSAA